MKLAPHLEKYMVSIICKSIEVLGEEKQLILDLRLRILFTKARKLICYRIYFYCDLKGKNSFQGLQPTTTLEKC